MEGYVSRKNQAPRCVVYFGTEAAKEAFFAWLETQDSNCGNSSRRTSATSPICRSGSRCPSAGREPALRAARSSPERLTRLDLSDAVPDLHPDEGTPGQSRARGTSFNKIGIEDYTFIVEADEEAAYADRWGSDRVAVLAA